MHKYKTYPSVFQINPLILLLLILSLFHFRIKAQSEEVDSLRKLLDQADQIDQIDLLHEIHKRIYYDDPLKSLHTVNEAISLALSLKKNEKLVRLYQDKAISFMFLSQYDSADFYVRKGLNLAEQLKDEYGTASCLGLHGSVWWYKSDYEKAQECYESSLEKFLLIGDSVRIFNCYSNLGTLHFATGAYDEALEHYSDAFQMIDTVLYPGDASVCLNDMGLIYQQKGNNGKALHFFLRALEFSKKAERQRSIATNLNNIGSVFLAEKKYEKALEYYFSGYRTDSLIGNYFGMAQSLVSISLIFEKTNRPDSALVYLNKAEGIYQFLDNTHGKGEVLFRKGNVFLLKDQLISAENAYKNAVKTAREINDNATLANALTGLGESLFLRKKYKTALIHFLESDSLAKTFGYTNVRLKNIEYLADIYHYLKNYPKEIEYLRAGSNLKDSLYSLEKDKIMSEMMARFQVDRTEAELEILNKERIINKNKLIRQRIILIAVLSVLLSMILAGALLLKRYRDKKRTNMLLEYHSREIEEKQSEIETQNEQLELQAIELRELDKMKSRFFENISHEFRTPLSLIIGPLEELIKKSKDKTKEQLQLMQRNAEKLLELIDELLDISKIDKGVLKAKLIQADINQHIKYICEIFSSYAEEKGLELHVNTEENEILAWYDKEKIEKILNNLISNAIKHTDTGSILVSTKQMKDHVEIRVIDTGRGIHADDLPYIFNRFYSAENSTQTGWGIGLAYVKELTELLKGTISVQSDFGEGSSFTLTFPLEKNAFEKHEYVPVDSKLPEEEGIKKSASLIQSFEKEPPDGITHSETILIVEDHDELRKFVSSELSNHYNVLEASNGSEGFEKAIEYMPDIVITDITMPEKDGIELTQSLKKNHETSHIPVIILTAKASKKSKIEGLKTRADDYLNKPFHIDELKVRIQNLLKIRQMLREKYMRSIEVNPSEITTNSTDEQFIMKLLKAVEQNMEDPELSVERLCEIVSISRSNLHKKLKSIVNQSATEFINTIRIKRAAQLIQQNAGTISEIAYDVGFNNVSYFNKLFKKHFDKTPKEMQ